MKYYTSILITLFKEFIDECNSMYEYAYWDHCYQKDRFWMHLFDYDKKGVRK